MAPRRGERDSGYALVAAVTAVAAFAYVAFEVLAANQGAAALVGGRIGHARLAAAAEAGLYLAIHGLATDDRATRWSIDGRSRDIDFDGVELAVAIDDERGKAPRRGRCSRAAARAANGLTPW
jgi:general secretion pathway protein K